jgi:hypothetical protein
MHPSKIKYKMLIVVCVCVCQARGIMDLLGIKFAPMNIPLNRRLQTLAACAWFVTLAFGPTLCIMFTAYVILFTRYSILAVLYIMWICHDRDVSNRGGRR